jgi:hypothetical protein
VVPNEKLLVIHLDRSPSVDPVHGDLLAEMPTAVAKAAESFGSSDAAVFFTNEWVSVRRIAVLYLERMDRLCPIGM